MDKHAKIKSDLIKLSLRLQQEFGLRKEECMKFSLSYALVDANTLQIKGSWAKGGKYRKIPILKESQQQLIRDIAAVTKGALIEPERMYVDQMREYD